MPSRARLGFMWHPGRMDQEGLMRIQSKMGTASARPQGTRSKAGAWDQALVMLVSGSLFLPWVVSVGVIWIAAFYVMADYRRRAAAVRSPWIKLLFGMLFFNFFVAAFYHNYRGVIMVLGFLAMVLYGSYVRTVMTRALFHRMADFMCLMSIPGIVVAIVQKAAMFATSPGYRPISFYFNANYFGMMIEFTVLLTMYRAYANRRARPFYAVVVLMNLIGMYLCGSMSGLMGMTCGVLLFLLLKRRYKICGVFVLVVLLFLIAGNHLPGVLPRDEVAVDTTMTQRLSVWHGALQGIAQQPLLGHGIMAYSMMNSQFGTYPTFHCHNLYLDTLLNFGVLGAAVFAIVFATQIVRMIRQVRMGASGNVGLLVLMATAVIFIHGFTDVTIIWTQTGMLYLLIFAASGIRAHRSYEWNPFSSVRPVLRQPDRAEPVYASKE